jgi:hypothetical protein
LVAILFISPLVNFQHEIGSIYFDLSGAFDLVLHPILLYEPCAYGPSGGYVKWFRSYYNNRQHSVRVLDNFLYIRISLGVPQGIILGHLFMEYLLTTFIM